MKQGIFPVLFVCLLGSGILLSGCDKGDKPEQSGKAAEQSGSQADAATKTDGSTATDNGEQVAATGLDVHPGKILHDANCISCHDAKVYTRGDRKVLDFTQLGAQVRRCDANLGTTLFDEELEQIADYLNQAYYQFDK